MIAEPSKRTAHASSGRREASVRLGAPDLRVQPVAVHRSAMTANKNALFPEDQQIEPSMPDLHFKKVAGRLSQRPANSRDNHSVRGTKSRLTDSAPLADAVTANIIGAIEPSAP